MILTDVPSGTWFCRDSIMLSVCKRTQPWETAWSISRIERIRDVDTPEGGWRTMTDRSALREQPESGPPRVNNLSDHGELPISIPSQYGGGRAPGS